MACGYIADFPQVDSLLLNNVCLIISTIAVASTPFCHSYAAYIIMSIFFGIAICKYLNCRNCQTSIILETANYGHLFYFTSFEYFQYFQY